MRSFGRVRLLPNIARDLAAQAAQFAELHLLALKVGNPHVGIGGIVTVAAHASMIRLSFGIGKLLFQGGFPASRDLPFAGQGEGLRSYLPERARP